jgi:hypothetical protein
MAARAQALTQRFEQVNGEIIAFVDGCDDQQWQTVVPEEQRTVAVMAHHVAGAYPVIVGWITSLAQGQPVEITMEQIDQANAIHKQRYAQVTREEVSGMLRRGGAAAATAVAALDDQQLDSRAMMGPAGRELTARQVIEYVLVAHTANHFANMRRAVGH